MHRALPSLLAVLALSVACASAPPRADSPAELLPARRPSERVTAVAGAAVVSAAVEMIGVPYRFGGASPRGFDCSGLVVYSYARAGYPGLPHSAKGLAAVSRPVAIERLEPGDLMFFELARRKPAHVGIYVGNRQFIHAPSSGGRVEIVNFDHVFWGRHIHEAGRLLAPSARVAQLASAPAAILPP